MSVLVIFSDGVDIDVGPVVVVTMLVLAFMLCWLSVVIHNLGFCVQP